METETNQHTESDQERLAIRIIEVADQLSMTPNVRAKVFGSTIHSAINDGNWDRALQFVGLWFYEREKL